MSPREMLRLIPPDDADRVTDAAPPDPPPRDELDPVVRAELAGRFRIGPLLRRGARSSVYDAREVAGGRRVALRVVARASLAEAGLDGAGERAVARAGRLQRPKAAPYYPSRAPPRRPLRGHGVLGGR